MRVSLHEPLRLALELSSYSSILVIIGCEIFTIKDAPSLLSCGGRTLHRHSPLKFDKPSQLRRRIDLMMQCWRWSPGTQERYRYSATNKHKTFVSSSYWESTVLALNIVSVGFEELTSTCLGLLAKQKCSTSGRDH